MLEKLEFLHFVDVPPQPVRWKVGFVLNPRYSRITPLFLVDYRAENIIVNPLTVTTTTFELVFSQLSSPRP